MHLSFSKKPGFSLIELLVIVSVVVFLMAISLSAFSNIRGLSRDSVRVVHATQIQTALRAYYRDHQTYPNFLTPGQSFVSNNITYMDIVPNNPLPISDNCSAYPEYTYSKISPISYSLTFCLGEDTADVSAGLNYVLPNYIGR